MERSSYFQISGALQVNSDASNTWLSKNSNGFTGPKASPAKTAAFAKSFGRDFHLPDTEYFLFYTKTGRKQGRSLS